jgi:hypothetical protein
MPAAGTQSIVHSIQTVLIRKISRRRFSILRRTGRNRANGSTIPDPDIAPQQKSA